MCVCGPGRGCPDGLNCLHFLYPGRAPGYRVFLHLPEAGQSGLCWSRKTSVLAGPGGAPSFATAETAQVERLDHETPPEVTRMEEVEENFSRNSGNDIPGTEF